MRKIRDYGLNSLSFCVKKNDTEQDLLEESLILGRSIAWLKDKSESIIQDIVALDSNESLTVDETLAQAKALENRLNLLEARLVIEDKAYAAWRQKFRAFLKTQS